MVPFDYDWVASNCDKTKQISCYAPSSMKSYTQTDYIVPKLIGCGQIINKDPVLNTDTIYISKFMTIQFCIEFCQGLEMKISALNYDHCQCLVDTRDIQQHVPESYCNQHCSGNEYQKCGSMEYLEHFSLYRVNGFFDDFDNTYDALANNCKEYYKLGIIPNVDECLKLKSKNGETINCCWNNIDPQNMKKPCENQQALQWNGKCYISKEI